jgi:hypothetical protein
MSLEQFESLVLTQKPAMHPWQPVTDYSVEARAAIEGQHPQLIKDVFNPQIIADMGCGRDAHLVKLLRALDCCALGVDPQVRESPFARHLIRGSLLDPVEGVVADLIICREVLEHLTVRQIRQAVTNLCKLSSKFVYVTTRFAKAPQSLLDVDTFDELDPTHISMLNQDLLRVLFVLEGFKRRADLEARMDWQSKGRVLVYERAV